MMISSVKKNLNLEIRNQFEMIKPDKIQRLCQSSHVTSGPETSHDSLIFRIL